MERSSFPRVSASTRMSKDTSPLLTPDVAMSNLDPRPYADSPSVSSSSPPMASRFLSPSQSAVPSRFLDSPGSSYKDNFASPSLSPSPSRTRFAHAYNNEYVADAPQGIPPPITASMMVPRQALGPARAKFDTTSQGSYPSARPRSTSRNVSEFKASVPAPSYMVNLQRLEAGIQVALQRLLDAQSVGLSRGRPGSSPNDDISESGSTTPTSRSLYLSQATLRNGRERSRGPIIPVRQPLQKHISLRGARKGIGNSLQDLASLKIQQENYLVAALKTVQLFTDQLSEWEMKLSGFSREIVEINSGPESHEIEELSSERDAVQTEIRDLEDRLLSLRARYGYLDRNITELTNRQEATMSSFVEGRKITEREREKWLQKPGLELEEVAGIVSVFRLRTKSADTTEKQEGVMMYLDLPPKRRTTDMAVAFLRASNEALEDARNQNEVEKKALEDGADIWNTTMDIVSEFEEEMRSQLKQKDLGNGTATLRAQISRMAGVIESLSEKLQYAEEKGYNLLICAIGAELEAFREGRVLLLDVLRSIDPATAAELDGDSASSNHQSTSTPLQEGKEDGQNNGQNGGQNNGLNELVEHNARVSQRAAQEGQSDSEDDGPHPDLLTELAGDDNMIEADFER